MIREKNRKLILETGEEYDGYAFGAEGSKVVELVFNTSMVGYQEILSDPSYTDQAVVMTYPLIGNYGMNRDDNETKTPSVSGMVVRELCQKPSNFRLDKSLDDVMKKYGILGLEGVDTRKLTRIIREHGTCRAYITDMETSKEEALRIIAETPIWHDAVPRVSSKKKWMMQSSKPSSKALKVALIDCGVKHNIIRSLVKRDCDVTIFPYDTPAEEIMKANPHGILISNGPGNPEDVTQVIELIRELRGKIPIFGICLGSQMISLAYGAKTYKLHFGHRGGNHPVKDLMTGKIEITSQNHSYAVDRESLENTDLDMTHYNLLDATVEGVACMKDRCFGIQYHPESAPGPEDSGYLFDRFIRWMQQYKKEKAGEE